MFAHRVDWRAILILVLLSLSPLVLVGCKSGAGQVTPPPATIIRAEEPDAEQAVEKAPEATASPIPAPPTLPPPPSEIGDEAYPYPNPHLPQGPSESPTPVVYPSPTLKN